MQDREQENEERESVRQAILCSERLMPLASRGGSDQ